MRRSEPAYAMDKSDIIEAVRKKPVFVIGAGAAVLLLGTIFLHHGHAPRPRADDPPPVTKCFYSTDDGATWFVGDTAKAPPFDTPQGIANRARVFRCGDKAFVNHLERYPQDVKRDIDSVSGSERDRLIAQAEYMGKVEVKRPGEEQWVSRDDPQKYMEVVRPRHEGCDAQHLQPVTAQ